MGSYSSVTAKYDYKVTIDLENLIDNIVSKFPGDFDWELDGTEIVITGSAECRAKTWYCRATLESPEEYEIDLVNSIAELDIGKIVDEAMHNTDKMRVDCEIPDESIEVEEDEPDENDAYDRWRDSYYE